MRKRLEAAFPRLSGTDFRITSPEDPGYNCLAWATGDSSRWWEPDPEGMYFWPERAPRSYVLAAWIELFRMQGYVETDSKAPEPECEKIALFVGDDGSPTHVARQLSSGKWTSKLGGWEDIEHALNGLEGGSYGRVGAIFKRAQRVGP